MKRWLLGLLTLTLAAGPAASQDRIGELERKLDILTREIETLKLGEAAKEPETVAEQGFGPAASKVYRVGKGLSIGGYGELLYQRFDKENDSGIPSGKTADIDALRAILYIGYKFSDRLLFNSEIELEHADEASLEFAYLDYRWTRAANLRAGLLLMPVGLINELHEPPAFNGSKRPATETRLIPTTWRENGIGLFGSIGPLTYRAYLVNSSSAASFSKSGLRGGRQNGSKAVADDLSFVVRADLEAAPGIDLGGSVVTGRQGQALSDAAGSIHAATTLWEFHGIFRRRGAELKTLYAQANINDAARLNAKFGRGVARRMVGWYLEASYDLLSGFDTEKSLTPFYRYEQVDTQNRLPTGTAQDPAQDETIHTFGIGFKPVPNVVYKADYQNIGNAAGTGVNQWNLAVGWLF